MISDKQLKQLTETLKSQMPNFFKRDELKKLLDSATAKYKISGIYEKKHYPSFKAFCAAIPDLLKGGYTIEPTKCSSAQLHNSFSKTKKSHRQRIKRITFTS